MQDCHSTATVPESQMPFGEKKKKRQQQKINKPKTNQTKTPSLWFLGALKRVQHKRVSPREHATDPLEGQPTSPSNSAPRARSLEMRVPPSSPPPPHVPWRRFAGAGGQCQPGRLSAASHLAGSTACQHAQRHPQPSWHHLNRDRPLGAPGQPSGADKRGLCCRCVMPGINNVTGREISILVICCYLIQGNNRVHSTCYQTHRTPPK